MPFIKPGEGIDEWGLFVHGKWYWCIYKLVSNDFTITSFSLSGITRLKTELSKPDPDVSSLDLNSALVL